MKAIKAIITGIIFTLLIQFTPDASPVECSTFGMVVVIWTWLVLGDK